MASIFTKIINGDIPSYKIAENENFFAFLDINPLTEGHTLVVPKKEIDYIFDLDNETLGEMMIFAKTIAGALDKSIKCVRVGVIVIGTEVPHAHIHLIPFNDEAELNFKREKLKLSEDKFKSIASKIKTKL
ncbi:MAG: HIT family protein [Bacteroidetes bacterium]|nr:MAG: HIT family protein [Bacteroidota bacterium]